MISPGPAFLDRETEAFRSRQENGAGFVEGKDGGVVAASRCRRRVLNRNGGLAAARRSDEQGAGATVDTAAEEGVEGGHAAGNGHAFEVDAVLRSRQARKYFQAAGADREVMKAAAKVAAPEFDDLQLPLRLAVGWRPVVQRNHTVRDALQLKIRTLRRPIVEQEHSAFAADEELLESKNLPPIAQRALRQQAQLRKRVEDHPVRANALDGFEDAARRPGELHFARVVHRDVRLAVEILLAGDQLQDLDLVERPAVRTSARREFLLGLGQGDVEAAFTCPEAFEKVLESERRLACTGVAIEQVQATANEAASQHIVQTLDPQRRALTNSVQFGLPFPWPARAARKYAHRDERGHGCAPRAEVVRQVDRTVLTRAFPGRDR